LPKLPVVSGTDLVKALLKLNYIILRQKGSHIQLQNKTISDKHLITIPNHKVIAFGTLNDIIKSICEKNNLTKDEFLKLL